MVKGKVNRVEDFCTGALRSVVGATVAGYGIYCLRQDPLLGTAVCSGLTLATTLAIRELAKMAFGSMGFSSRTRDELATAASLICSFFVVPLVASSLGFYTGTRVFFAFFAIVLGSLKALEGASLISRAFSFYIPSTRAHA